MVSVSRYVSLTIVATHEAAQTRMVPEAETS
jgi:hypothetical protein